MMLGVARERGTFHDEGLSDTEAPPELDAGSAASAADFVGNAGEDGMNETVDDLSGLQDEFDEATLKKKKKASGPRLDAKLLLSERGLAHVDAEFRKVKFSTTRGSERSNLGLLLDSYHVWAQNLYSDYTFSDFADAIEKLGHKNEVKEKIVDMRIKADLAKEDAAREAEERERGGYESAADHGRQEESSSEDEFDSPRPAAQVPPQPQTRAEEGEMMEEAAAAARPSFDEEEELMREMEMEMRNGGRQAPMDTMLDDATEMEEMEREMARQQRQERARQAQLAFQERARQVAAARAATATEEQDMQE